MSWKHIHFHFNLIVLSAEEFRKHKRYVYTVQYIQYISVRTAILYCTRLYLKYRHISIFCYMLHINMYVRYYTVCIAQPFLGVNVIINVGGNQDYCKSMYLVVLFLERLTLKNKTVFLPSNWGWSVKASNFVILLGENIFLWQTSLWLLHDFFRYWSLYSNGLGIGQSHFGLGHCLGLKNKFFQRVTNLGDRLLISSPSKVLQVNIPIVNRGC
jgi:hypothetical protein